MQCSTTEDVNPLSWRLLILLVFRGVAGDFFELPVTVFSLTDMIVTFRDRIQSNVNTVLCFISNADLEYPILLTSLSVYSFCLFLGSISFLGDMLQFLGKGRR